jgi:hypothetical protein
VPAGRPTKLNPKAVETARKLSALGCSVPTIAQEIGVDAKSVYNWIKEGEAGKSQLHTQFLQAIQSGTGKVEESCLSALAKALRSDECRDSTPAAQWMLTHHPRLRDRWSDAAATRRAIDQVLTGVAKGLSESGLTPDQQQAAILAMRANGVGVTDASSD